MSGLTETCFIMHILEQKVFLITPNFHPKSLPSHEELKILENYRGKIPDEVFTEVSILRQYCRGKWFKKNLRTARRLIKRKKGG